MDKINIRPRIGKNLDKAMSQDLDLEMPNKIRNNCKLASCWVWDKTVNDIGFLIIGTILIIIGQL